MIGRGLLSVGVVVALAWALAGCAPAYSEATADDLRKQVMQVTAATAAGDWTGARAALDALSEDVDEAHADGRIDEERRERIDAAIATVAADLDAGIAAAEAAAAAAAEEQRIAEEQAAADPKPKGPGERGPKRPGRR